MAMAISCKEDNNSLNPVKPEEGKIAELSSDIMNFLVEEGFSTDRIRFDGNTIYLEGDISLSLEGATNWMTGSNETSGKVNQRKHSFILNNSAATYITVGFHATFAANAEWLQAARDAMAYLNNVPGTTIQFFETTTNPEILVSFDNNIDPLAVGALPTSSTSAGPYVKVNLNRVNGLAPTAAAYNIPMQDVRQSIMVHEFGHTLGFRHTNSTDGTFITCSPTNDAYSIMKDNLNLTDGSFRKTFTRGDILSTQILYPDVNKIIYYPSGNISFGQLLNVHWHSNLIADTYVRLKIWQIIQDVEHEELEVTVPNNGSYAFPIGPMIQTFDYVNVTQPDRDTELDFCCFRIEMTRIPSGEVIDATTNFTAHFSEYL